MSSSPRSWCLAFVLALVALLALTPAALANSYVVTRSDDPDNGVGSCAIGGSCSLREAINAANGNAGVADTITFSGVTSVALNHTTAGTNSGLTSTDALTIDGGNGVTVTGDSSVNNLLVIQNGQAGAISVTVKNLTLDGTAINTINGGADVSISPGAGAATTTATLDHMTIENGTSQAGGGGIQSTGFLNLVDSTVKNNHVTAGARGAGVDIANGTASILRSTISGNTAPNDLGGGVEIRGGASVSAVSIVDSTITGNSALDGGGIDDGTGVLKLSFSTVTANTTSSGTSGALDFEGFHTDQLKANIINNAGTSSHECSTTGDINTGGFNLIQDASCGAGGTNSNQVTAVSVGALQNNGGPTFTQALSSPSTAIDYVPTASCKDLASTAITLDQRSVARPQGSACDVGAFEFVPGPTNSVAPSISGTPGIGQTLTCDPGTWSGSPTFAFEWRRDGTAITGATGSTYNVAAADGGHQLLCHVTATNSGGSASADSAPVTVPVATGGTNTGGSTTTKDTTAPVISAFVISPSAFRAASSGATTAAKRKRAPIGAKVKYTLSEAATVKFTVVRVLAGRKKGGTCQAPSARNRKGKPCKRIVTIGSFTLTGKAGANSFVFRGRIRGKALPRGNYKLVIQATDAAGNTSVKSNRPFRIVR